MTVGSFDPGGETAGALSPADLDTLLAASGDLDRDKFGLSDHEIARLGRLARTDGADWAAAVDGLGSDQIEALIRLLVLAEARLPEFESGDRSPVVPLARLLRSRKAYPARLTPWIRAHSNNRFLPHGSLMDRL